jgi:hypothetical protein
VSITIYDSRGGVLKQVNGASYDGSKTGKEFANWNAQSPNHSEFILDTYDKLAARCATLYNTSSYCRALVKKPLAYSIGRGLFFRSLPNWKMLGIDKEQAKEWGRKFTMLLHFDKLAVNHYAKQHDLMSERSITGDSMLFFLRENNGKPFDLVTASSVMVIDSDHTVANEYTLGIKHDNYSRRSGFWSRADQKEYSFFDKNGDRNAIQLMFRERSGQIRGYGDYYWGIAHAKNADRVWDATIERMVLESIQLGWITANPNDMKQQAQNMAQASRGRRIHNDGDNSTGFKDYGTALTPGGMPIWENKDFQINFTDLKTPSNNFSNAMVELRRLLAMGRGVAPEFVVGEYSTSFTAHKGALNDTMKTIYFERQRYAEQVEKQVNLEYLKYYVRTGMLEVMPGFWDSHYIQEAYLAGKWIGEVPGHVNPLQEVKSNIEAVGAGFMLRADAAANNGYSDFDAFLDEREDQEYEFKSRSGEEKTKIIMDESEEMSV